MQNSLEKAKYDLILAECLRRVGLLGNSNKGEKENE